MYVYSRRQQRAKSYNKKARRTRATHLRIRHRLSSSIAIRRVRQSSSHCRSLFISSVLSPNFANPERQKLCILLPNPKSMKSQSDFTCFRCQGLLWGFFPEPCLPRIIFCFPGLPHFSAHSAAVVVDLLPSQNMSERLIDERWESNVRPLFSDLVQVLDPHDTFLDRLYGGKLVTNEEYDDLFSMSSRENRSRKLLRNILPRKGMDSYDRLVAILKETEGQEHVAKALGERMGNNVNDGISTYTFF